RRRARRSLHVQRPDRDAAGHRRHRRPPHLERRHHRVGVTSPSVDLRTSNGRIEVSFAEAPDSVRARTSNGRIEVLVPSGSGPYRVDASASNGRTQIDVDTSRSAELEMDLSTSNGNIFVRYVD